MTRAEVKAMTVRQRKEWLLKRLIIRWLKVIRPYSLKKNEVQAERMAKDIMKICLPRRRNEIH